MMSWAWVCALSAGLALLVHSQASCRPTGASSPAANQSAEESAARAASGARQLFAFDSLFDDERGRATEQASSKGLDKKGSSAASRSKGRQLHYYQPVRYQLAPGLAYAPGVYQQQQQQQPAAPAGYYARPQPAEYGFAAGAGPMLAAQPATSGKAYQAAEFAPATSWSRYKGYSSGYSSGSSSSSASSSSYSAPDAAPVDEHLPNLREVYELELPEVKVFSTKSTRKSKSPYKTVVTFKSVRAGVSPLDYERLFEPEVYVQQELGSRLPGPTVAPPVDRAPSLPPRPAELAAPTKQQAQERPKSDKLDELALDKLKLKQEAELASKPAELAKQAAGLKAAELAESLEAKAALVAGAPEPQQQSSSGGDEALAAAEVHKAQKLDELLIRPEPAGPAKAQSGQQPAGQESDSEPAERPPEQLSQEQADKLAAASADLDAAPPPPPAADDDEDDKQESADEVAADQVEAGADLALAKHDEPKAMEQLAELVSKALAASKLEQAPKQAAGA